MPQKGIHPLLNTMRVVMRDGSSFNVQTTLRRIAPYMLQVDTTTNPVYTGESSGLSFEDKHTQAVMSRYEGFIADDAGDKEAPAAAASSSKQPTKK